MHSVHVAAARLSAVLGHELRACSLLGNLSTCAAPYGTVNCNTPVLHTLRALHGIKCARTDISSWHTRDRCLRTLTVRGLATIVTVAAGARAHQGLLMALLQHGTAEALLSVLEMPQHQRSSLITVRSLCCAQHAQHSTA